VYRRSSRSRRARVSSSIRSGIAGPAILYTCIHYYVRPCNGVTRPFCERHVFSIAAFKSTSIRALAVLSSVRSGNHARSEIVRAGRPKESCTGWVHMDSGTNDAS
jgi:hypothetical protein